MKTILIVDIDPSASSLAEFLRRVGYHGITVPNPQEALALIQGGSQIDLVVTEMQFPDVDGLHFLIALRAIVPRLPVIVVTGSGSIESYLHAVNLGVYEYLNKPVPPKELVRIASIALAVPWAIPPLQETSFSAGRSTDRALRHQNAVAKTSDT